MHIPSSLSPHRLAITGMALLNALGTSVTEVWNNSRSMRSGICPLRTRFDDPPHFVDSAHFIPGINSYCGVIGHANLECTRQDLGLPPQDFRAMSTSTRMSLFMAKQAIEAAGLVEAGYDPQRVAVIVSQNSGESASTLWDVNLSVRGRWLAGLAAQVGQWSAEQQEDFYQRLTQGRVQPDESTMLYRLNCTAAGAICQRYGFEGPAFSVGAACSSSMAALYSAHNLIQAGIIDAAVVGGGEEGYAPLYFTEFSALGALARPSEYITTPEAHSRPFDLHRNGFVLGEGAAMIVVEREDLARKRSAPVHGMVTAVSNITNTLGLVEPSAYAQAQAIRHSFSTLDYGPEAVDLVECHATSTPLGDLAEAQSLRECFGHKQRPTVLSGYKAQIGHTTGASGLTSLIHGLCAMREGLFPGTLNYDSPDPALQLDEARLRILSTPETWETPATGIRRLQINTFGFGGSCFVAQVEEPNDRQPERMHPIPATLNPHTSRPQSLFQGQESLVDGARMISLPHQGRIWRLGATTPLWMNELAGLSAAPENAELTALSRRGLWLSPPVPAPAVAVMCCGQGSVWPGMGRALYDTFPAAREAMDRIAKVADWDILGLMDETSVDKIILTRWQQPYLFLLEYAQAHYLTTLGLKPVVMSGHSLGELIALCLAGVYTPETAWTILDTRSLFMAQVEAEASNETGMMSVHCSPEVLEATLKEWPELHVSNYNTPMQVILSGTRSLLQEVRKVLRKRRVPAMLLNVSLAFHHPHMRALREASLARLHRLDFHAPALPMMSNITTGLYPQTKDEIINYIADLDENSVRWVECVRAMWNTYNIRHFVEMGPGDTLCGLVSDIENQAVCVATDRKGKEVEAMRSAVARLYALGHLPMRAGHGGPRPALAEKKPAAAPTSHEVYEEHIEKVMPIIAQATGYTREELQADMDLRHDLAIRSSRFPLIIHETERQFQIKLRFEDMLGVATIRDLADVLRKLQQQENTPATAKARPAEHAVEPPLPPVLRYSPDLQDIPLAEPKAVRVAALVLVTSQACAPLQHRLADLYPDIALHLCATVDEARRLLTSPTLPTPRGLILALSPAPIDNSDVQEPSQALSAYFPLIKDFCTTKGSSFCLAVQPSPQPDLRAEQPVLAGLTGFFLAAALEYPACLFRTVSLGDKAPPHWLAQTLTPATPALPRPVQWLCADNACRSLQLHAQALDPALALCAESSRGQGLPLRRGDILVVPGGARGISPYALSSLAPWACTFVLLGRKAVPASSAESAALTRLRALGGTVEHLVCDVNDAEAVNRTLLDIKQRLGRIDGIIYTAGITRDATLDKMDRATFDTVVQTKCQGLWHCLEAARPAGLRYAVVFSSIAAWLGNYAQANYCAANRAMTAFVHRYARAHGLVSRGLWLPPICGAGMAASAEIQEQMRARGLEHACVHCEELGDLFARELFCGAAPDCLWARVLPAVPHVSAAAALSHRAMVGQFERPEAFPLVFPINAYAALTGLGTAPAGTCFTGGHNFSRYSPTMTTWNTPAASTPPLSTVSAGMLLACLMETAAQNCPWLTVTSIRNFTLTRPLAVYGGLTRETRITSLVLPWNLNSARITRICTTDMHVHTLADNGRKQAGLRPVCHGESVLEAQALVVPSLKDSSLISALASPDCVYEIIPAMPVCTTKTLFYGQILDACFDIALRICSRESKAEVTIKSIDEIVFSSQNIKVSQDMQVCLRASTRPSQTAVHFDGEITDKQGNVYSILHNIIFDEQAS